MWNSTEIRTKYMKNFHINIKSFGAIRLSWLIENAIDYPME